MTKRQGNGGEKWGGYTIDEIAMMAESDKADPSFQERQRRNIETYELVMLSKRCLMSKDYENALRFANQAVEHSPTFTTAYLARAYALSSMGNHVAAEQDLLKLLEIDPDDVFARRALKNYRAQRRLGFNGNSGCLLSAIITVSLLGAVFLIVKAF